jgi:hypothetical protein
MLRRAKLTILRHALQDWQAVVGFGQRRMCAVSRGEKWVPRRPSDGERRIVPGDADLARRIVDIGALVFDLRDRTDDVKAVGEPGGTYTCMKFSAVRLTDTHRPKVGEPRRTSTATSKISPSMT